MARIARAAITGSWRRAIAVWRRTWDWSNVRCEQDHPARQRGDSPQFRAVLKAITVSRLGPGRARTRLDRVLADKAYGSRANRSCLRRRGIACTIPEEASRPPSGGPSRGRGQGTGR